MYEQQNSSFFSPQEKESVRLSKRLREMGEGKNTEVSVFEDIGEDMQESGFCLARANDVAEIFQEQNFLCRSESFQKVMDSLIANQDIDVANYGDEANMCIMASGKGFRVAMMEGFSGKEVGSKVKVVIVFKRDHLISTQPIGKDSSLWNVKKETAEVSLRGKGRILSGDIEMVSFRFPVKYFPENLLTEQEQDSLDDEKISFIVRHYIKNKKAETIH